MIPSIPRCTPNTTVTTSFIAQINCLLYFDKAEEIVVNGVPRESTKWNYLKTGDSVSIKVKTGALPGDQIVYDYYVDDGNAPNYFVVINNQTSYTFLKFADNAYKYMRWWNFKTGLNEITYTNGTNFPDYANNTSLSTDPSVPIVTSIDLSTTSVCYYPQSKNLYFANTAGQIVSKISLPSEPYMAQIIDSDTVIAACYDGKIYRVELSSIAQETQTVNYYYYVLDPTKTQVNKVIMMSNTQMLQKNSASVDLVNPSNRAIKNYGEFDELSSQTEIKWAWNNDIIAFTLWKKQKLFSKLKVFSYDAVNNILWVGGYKAIWKLDLNLSVISVAKVPFAICELTSHPNGTAYASSTTGRILKIDSNLNCSAIFVGQWVSNILLSDDKNYLFFSDSGDQRVYKYSVATSAKIASIDVSKFGFSPSYLTKNSTSFIVCGHDSKLVLNIPFDFSTIDYVIYDKTVTFITNTNNSYYAAHYLDNETLLTNPKMGGVFYSKEFDFVWAQENISSPPPIKIAPLGKNGVNAVIVRNPTATDSDSVETLSVNIDGVLQTTANISKNAYVSFSYKPNRIGFFQWPILLDQDVLDLRGVVQKGARFNRYQNVPRQIFFNNSGVAEFSLVVTGDVQFEPFRMSVNFGELFLNGQLYKGELVHLGDTIRYVIRSWSKRHTIINFCIGSSEYPISVSSAQTQTEFAQTLLNQATSTIVSSNRIFIQEGNEYNFPNYITAEGDAIQFGASLAAENVSSVGALNESAIISLKSSRYVNDRDWLMFGNSQELYSLIVETGPYPEFITFVDLGSKNAYIRVPESFSFTVSGLSSATVEADIVLTNGDIFYLNGGEDELTAATVKNGDVITIRSTVQTLDAYSPARWLYQTVNGINYRVASYAMVLDLQMPFMLLKDVNLSKIDKQPLSLHQFEDSHQFTIPYALDASTVKNIDPQFYEIPLTEQINYPDMIIARDAHTYSSMVYRMSIHDSSTVVNGKNDIRKTTSTDPITLKNPFFESNHQHQRVFLDIPKFHNDIESYFTYQWKNDHTICSDIPPNSPSTPHLGFSFASQIGTSLSYRLPLLTYSTLLLTVDPPPKISNVAELRTSSRTPLINYSNTLHESIPVVYSEDHGYPLYKTNKLPAIQDTPGFNDIKWEKIYTRNDIKFYFSGKIANANYVTPFKNIDPAENLKYVHTLRVMEKAPLLPFSWILRTSDKNPNIKFETQLVTSLAFGNVSTNVNSFTTAPLAFRESHIKDYVTLKVPFSFEQYGMTYTLHSDIGLVRPAPIMFFQPKYVEHLSNGTGYSVILKHNDTPYLGEFAIISYATPLKVQYNLAPNMMHDGIFTYVPTNKNGLYDSIAEATAAANASGYILPFFVIQFPLTSKYSYRFITDMTAKCLFPADGSVVHISYGLIRGG